MSLQCWKLRWGRHLVVEIDERAVETKKYELWDITNMLRFFCRATPAQYRGSVGSLSLRRSSESQGYPSYMSVLTQFDQGYISRGTPLLETSVFDQEMLFSKFCLTAWKNLSFAVSRTRIVL